MVTSMTALNMAVVECEVVDEPPEEPSPRKLRWEVIEIQKVTRIGKLHFVARIITDQPI